jgi:hypothetical protein
MLHANFFSKTNNCFSSTIFLDHQVAANKLLGEIFYSLCDAARKQNRTWKEKRKTGAILCGFKIGSDQLKNALKALFTALSATVAKKNNFDAQRNQNEFVAVLFILNFFENGDEKNQQKTNQ